MTEISVEQGTKESAGPFPLSILGLTYRYRPDSAAAISDLTFNAGAGEIVLIAGASGSGKTTLLRCLNGLIPHSYKKGQLEGRIRIKGQDPSGMKLADISRLVGTVLQDPEKQIVSSYVANEVAFGLENMAVPREEMKRRINESLNHLGILHLRDRETFQLSGGEKQKVVVAGTLVLEPDILLLDEPLANLDPASVQDTLTLIRELADEGKSILIIEHRVEDVLRIKPDKVLFLVDGRQRYFGDVAGFERVADPREVKLAAPLIIRRMAEERLDYTGGELIAPRPSANGALLHFENVGFWYEPNQPVLKSVNLTMGAGEVVAILGPNGAGKTTLVKHAIGLLKPKEGRVLVAGAETTAGSVAQTARAVGYVFQSPSHMLFAPTVAEELAFGPKNLGFDQEEIERSVSAALETVDLVEMAARPPLALSFGQQKRVTIAAIVAMRSRVLVMDEPTAGQDYRHYTEFMGAILHPAEDSPWRNAFESVIFISHDIDLAISYATRVLLVNDGRLVGDGPPHRVLADRELLLSCRLRPTSLLELNLQLLSKTGRFMRAELLAPYLQDSGPDSRTVPAEGNENGGT